MTNPFLFVPSHPACYGLLEIFILCWMWNQNYYSFLTALACLNIYNYFFHLRARAGLTFFSLMACLWAQKLEEMKGSQRQGVTIRSSAHSKPIHARHLSFFEIILTLKKSMGLAWEKLQKDEDNNQRKDNIIIRMPERDNKKSHANGKHISTGTRKR